ncbi:MAG: MFS transporter [Halobacteriaceae archaeon]
MRTRQRAVVWSMAVFWSVPVNLATTSLAVLIGRTGTAFEVGMVTTAHFLGLLVFAPLWGAVADITGRRRGVLVATGVLGTATLAVLAGVRGVWGPITLRGLYAAFFAAFPAVMLAVVSEQGGDAGRGRALGEFNSLRSVGFAAGQLGAGVLLGLASWTEIFVVLAAVNGLGTVAAVFVVDPADTGGTALTLRNVLAEARSRLFPAAGDRAHLTESGLHWVYVAVVCQALTFFGILSLAPVYLTGPVGVSEFVMGAFLALNPASRTFGMYAFGWAVDAVGRTPVLAGGLVATGGFAVGLAVATVPATPLGRMLVTGAAFLVIAAAYSATSIGSQSFIGDVADVERESELMGLRSTMLGVGGLVGPGVVGVLVGLVGYTAAFVAIGGVSVAGVLAVRRAVEPA